MISLLDPLQGWAAREGSLGDDFGRQAPPPAGIADVVAQLPEGSPDGQGRPVRGRHFCNLRVTSCWIYATRRLHFSYRIAKSDRHRNQAIRRSGTADPGAEPRDWATALSALSPNFGPLPGRENPAVRRTGRTSFGAIGGAILDAVDVIDRERRRRMKWQPKSDGLPSRAPFRDVAAIPIAIIRFVVNLFLIDRQ
jgi:hypothetical protein